MKLSEWARRQGITYKTAHRWFQQGVLPVDATQLSTGTILVRDESSTTTATGVALYARVSSSDQKGDLERQLARLVQFATEQEMAVTKTVTEVASGMNPRRTKLLRLLRDPKIGTIVVEHRERLARFGTEYLEAALTASGRRFVVIEEGELKDDLVRDMIEILTSFCARLYDRRSARSRAKRAVAAIEEG